MTLQQALQGSLAPPEILATQILLDLDYLGFDGQVHQGQLVIHRDLESEVRAIFAEILAVRFPIAQMVPVVAFNWSDDESMERNNCSSFNYREKVGKPELSVHATGHAIDINPMQNPYIRVESVLPPEGIYDVTAPGTLLEGSPVVVAFESRGWEWGGRWIGRKDWHHFEKKGS